jgi:DNA-binding transcriptional LysR family regulator
LGSDRALKVLRDSLVDVAIVMNNRFLTSSPGMVVETLYQEKIEVLMSVKHPLTEYTLIPWSELVKYPQVLFKDGYGMQRLVQEWFTLNNAKLKVVMELNTLDAFRGIVRQGETIALLPQAALHEARNDPTLAVRELEPFPEIPKDKEISLTREVVLVTTSDRLLLPPISHFCQLVRQLIKTTANNQS